jgi:hypothetical protein
MTQNVEAIPVGSHVAVGNEICIVPHKLRINKRQEVCRLSMVGSTDHTNKWAGSYEKSARVAHARTEFQTVSARESIVL